MRCLTSPFIPLTLLVTPALVFVRRVLGSALIVAIAASASRDASAQEAGPQPPTQVRVRHVVSDRYPELGNDDVATVLRIAAEMLAAGYGRDVRFVPAPRRAAGTPAAATAPAAAAPATRQTADDYFAALDRALGPYSPPASESFNPFAEGVDELLPACVNAVGAAGELSRLHHDMGLPEPFADEAAAARALAEAYRRRIAALRSLRGPDGKPRLGATAADVYPREASLSRWDLYLSHTGPKAEYDLVLFNGLLIEDSATFASFHTLLAATANGTAYPVANNAVVAYFPLTSDDPDVRSDRLGPLTESERLTAIAYAVAHEVGTHLMMLHRDDYRPGAGLARPLMAFSDKRDPLAYRTWQPPRVKPRPLNEMYFRCQIAKTRIGIAASRGDADTMLDELTALELLPADREWKARVMAWAEQLYERSVAAGTRPLPDDDR